MYWVLGYPMHALKQSFNTSPKYNVYTYLRNWTIEWRLFLHVHLHCISGINAKSAFIVSEKTGNKPGCLFQALADTSC